MYIITMPSVRILILFIRLSHICAPMFDEYSHMHVYKYQYTFIYVLQTECVKKDWVCLSFRPKYTQLFNL